MKREHGEIDRVWQAMVGMVMESRGDWRRNVTEATGLPFSRVRVLHRLIDGPLTLRALAESLGTDAPAATVAVNDLEKRGLVARGEHPEDRRAKLVSLMAAGRTALRALGSVPDHAPPLLTALSPEDVRMLVRIFDGANEGRGARSSGKKSR